MIRIALVVMISLGLATVTVAPRAAYADGPSKAERKKAKKLLLQAGREKRQGDKLAKRKGKRNRAKAQAAYRKAALAYIEAYSIVEAAALVFKLAEVYRARGEYKWARRGFRRYLEVAPDGDNADEAQAQVEQLEVLIAEHRDSGKPFPEDEDPELDPTAVFGFEKPEKPDEPEQPEEPDEPEQPDQPEEAAPVKVSSTKASASSNGKWLKWGGMGSAGAGAVFLTVGIVFGARASSAADTLSSNDDQWNLNDRNLISRGEADADKMVLFTTLGVVSLAAGGALYYLGMRADSNAEARLSVAPTTGGGMTGVVVGGRF